MLALGPLKKGIQHTSGKKTTLKKEGQRIFAKGGPHIERESPGNRVTWNEKDTPCARGAWRIHVYLIALSCDFQPDHFRGVLKSLVCFESFQVHIETWAIFLLKVSALASSYLDLKWPYLK